MKEVLEGIFFRQIIFTQYNTIALFPLMESQKSNMSRQLFCHTHAQMAKAGHIKYRIFLLVPLRCLKNYQISNIYHKVSHLASFFSWSLFFAQKSNLDFKKERFDHCVKCLISKIYEGEKVHVRTYLYFVVGALKVN